MFFIDVYFFCQIVFVFDFVVLYGDFIFMIFCFVQYGLIYGDFNEFNILIKEMFIKFEIGEDIVKVEFVFIDFL